MHIVVTSIEAHAVPTVAGRPVAEIVTTCHETSLDVGLARLAVAGLSRDTLEPVLTYCAEQRCIAEAASCPGCRRRNDVDGLATFDAFLSAHSEIRSAADGLVVRGTGNRQLVVPSFEALARDWAGEEVWFFARRVLRKLRHGVRTRAREMGAARTDAAPEDLKPSIVLVEPQLADNIGMVARAMANFGLEDLRLVAPRDGWPNERARIAASGATFVIDEATAYPNFAEALGSLQWVCATTARQRDLAKPVLTPAQAVVEMRARIARGERVGVIFGRERNGLETAEVAAADAVVMVPVDSRFASLNLAQAVLIVGYEWIKQDAAATLGRVTTYETPRHAGPHQRGFAPADKAALIGLFEHLEGELDRAGFFNPPAKRATMVQNLRTLITRAEPSDQEVRTLRGLIKALVHGKGPGRRSPGTPGS